jgi:hypothetical protein
MIRIFTVSHWGDILTAITKLSDAHRGMNIKKKRITF